MARNIFMFSKFTYHFCSFYNILRLYVLFCHKKGTVCFFPVRIQSSNIYAFHKITKVCGKSENSDIEWLSMFFRSLTDQFWLTPIFYSSSPLIASNSTFSSSKDLPFYEKGLIYFVIEIHCM